MVGSHGGAEVKSSLKWILKRQLGWITGAAFILIYAAGANAQIVELSTAYRYTAPGTDVVTTTNREVGRFNPAPQDDRPAQMDIAKLLSPDPEKFSPSVQINRPLAPPVVTSVTPAAAPKADKVQTSTGSKITSQKISRDDSNANSAAGTSLKESIAAPKAPDFFGSPVWGRGTEKDKWTRTVLSEVRANKKTLDKARDLETFCPGYRASSVKAQEMCWVIIMSAVSKKESDFIPGKAFREPNGEYSVGLLAMSGHQCRNAPTIRALKNPTENLKCGTRHMVKMIEAGRCISCKPGGGANWSVLRKPYRYYHSGLGKWLSLGKINEILAMTKPKFKSILREEAKFKEQARLASQATQTPQPAPVNETQSQEPARSQDTQTRVSTGRS